MYLLIPDENGPDCSSVLEKFVAVSDIAPSNVIDVRHRTYSEAEQCFLDYCDKKLKDDLKLSNFSLKSIDYGDPKQNFDFGNQYQDSVRQCMWDEVDALEVEIPVPMSELDGLRQAGKRIKRKRGENTRPPFLGFQELESEKLSSELVAQKAKRERNYEYAPDEFKKWYQNIISFMTFVPQNSNNNGWMVVDEYHYPNSVAPVAPLLPKVSKDSLRKEISKLKNEVQKAKNTNERLKEKSSKKSNVNEGDANTIEVLANNKAKALFLQWKNDDTEGLKEQIRSLRESRALLLQKNENLEKDLAEEKKKCADRDKDLLTNVRMHELQVKTLDQRVKELIIDKSQLQSCLFPRVPSMQPMSRRGENASLNQHSPDYLPGQKRLNTPGSGDSP